MSKAKNYFIYTICLLFTIIGIYLLIDSFINPDLELNKSILFKERLKNINGILFFGGLGFVYFILKNNTQNFNGNYSPKVNIALFFGCLIFVLNSLFLISYPEEFKRGHKLVKIIIG